MTEKLEEYIESIYEIQKANDEEHVHTSEIAKKLGVSAASATEMMQRLSQGGWVTYRAYYGVSLTQKGARMAKELQRKHRTMADFLQLIGVEKKVAQRDACQLEHHIGPATLHRLRSFVHFMKTDPNGKKVVSIFLRA